MKDKPLKKLETLGQSIWLDYIRRDKDADRIMAQLPELGISIDKVTQQLEDEGVRKFDEPFDKLMESLTKKASA